MSGWWNTPTPPLTTGYRLSFPRGMKADEVSNFLSGLSGMLPRWWKRWLGVPFVVVEIHASHAGIEHFLVVPRQWGPAVENLLQATVPSVRYEIIDVPTPNPAVGTEYQLSSNHRALRIDAASMATKLLTNLQPIGKGEAIWVQWLVAPAVPVPPPRLAAKADRSKLLLPPGAVRSSEELTSVKAKQSSTMLAASGRVGVRARTTGRAEMLLRHVDIAWSDSRAPGVHLRRRSVRREAVARRIGRRVVPATLWPSTYNSDEMAALIGWPIDAQSIPGVHLGGCRLLPAAPAVPRTGTIIGTSNFPGDPRPLALDVDGRLRNLHIVGPTGTGKSTLISNLVVQDMAAGHGVVVIDPKGGDLVEDVLARVPMHRLDDVVVFDPADETRPVGLNPLQATPTTAELVAENLLGLFKSLYRASWGPRTDDIMRATFLTLTTTGDATLCDVAPLLSDAGFRRRIVGSLNDPIGLSPFWDWYESISDAERVSVVGPVLNKVRAFTMRPRVRAIVGQTEPGLNIRDAITTNKILVVSLASGLLGEEAASLLGALIVGEVWQAVKARAAINRAERKPVMVFLDEFQRVLHLPTPMASVLAECRGLGMGLTIAHQELGQLPADVQAAVLANARSRAVFQLPAADARVMAREMHGMLTADELQGIGAFEMVTQLYASGAIQAPATARSEPLAPTRSDPATIRHRSRDRFGADRAAVEEALRVRQAGPPSNGPVGRRRRPPTHHSKRDRGES